MSSIFDLRKVINPHKHMPKDIKDAFFKVFEDQDYNNAHIRDSFINWKINESEYEDIGNDDGSEDDRILTIKKVNDWLLENGIEKTETVLILYW